jgi:putative redox protein
VTASPRPTVEAAVEWAGGTRLTARAGGGTVDLDWDGKTAVSPVQTLAVALASCMASDVVVILTRGRLPLRSLAVRVAGERAPADPRRLLKAEVRFEVGGDVPDEKVARAIALSRETYCSVWHSMARDIELATSFVVDRSAA